MGDRVNVIVVRGCGVHEPYRTGLSVGVDLGLLEGPRQVLAMLPGLPQDGRWLDDTMAQGGIVLDLGRKVLLF
ncbi:hypothetical protein ABZV80_41685 [Streptomyces sp. NPDC005132]|uniref:hypothetical protein n=1 Tax=Streptomyces sp. NPDC005132 TaxID=3154294 RepID=UPI0033BC3A89